MWGPRGKDSQIKRTALLIGVKKEILRYIEDGDADDDAL